MSISKHLRVRVGYTLIKSYYKDDAMLVYPIVSVSMRVLSYEVRGSNELLEPRRGSHAVGPCLLFIALKARYRVNFKGTKVAIQVRVAVLKLDGI